MDPAVFTGICHDSAMSLIGYMMDFFPSILLIVGFLAAVTILVNFVRNITGGGANK